jgi:hypothetical protein
MALPIPNAVLGARSFAARVFGPASQLLITLPWASTPGQSRTVTVSSLDAGGPPPVTIQDPSGVLYPVVSAVAVALGASNPDGLQSVATSGTTVATTDPNTVTIVVGFASPANEPQVEVLEVP